ncbi:nucleoside triphosphate pyrophosphohydrolase family protein [Marinisporobacter balticus]|uniref:MazG-like nucleotide pyrophosphohydrolase family protein n=1 Tax=Marinisporobacter balticus TaxID=2018667 RepID=A0A4R2K9V3_9FIRM|nr:nucleoside triphosphate pyrophosphohydrolase family protein [Marinisporobacter balticus]TCO69534.1 MazG-like nucleotide pyrophosphohydrolase family protein [Marinisporobacter balticus]
MKLNDYQKKAMRTDVKLEDEKQNILNAAMGMSGEAAETLEHMKKVLFQGHKLDKAKLIEETGDVFWYVAKMAEALGIDLSCIASYNIAKLEARYPKGFEAKRSIDRDEEK